MKYKYIIVSDLHLGTKDSKSKEFLEFIESHECETLILNGDIIDGWAINRGSRLKKIHTKVISKLISLSKTTNIVWVRGNHDEFISEFIGQGFGNIKIVEDLVIETVEWVSYDIFVNKRYFVFHGDVIDVFITKYKWLSKIGAVGYDLALWLNRIYNTYRKWRNLPYHSISQKIKDGVKTATMYINDFENTAVKMADKYKCDGVICGHIHQPSDIVIDEIRYLNSGDWVENLSSILIDNMGKIEIYYHTSPISSNLISV